MKDREVYSDWEGFDSNVHVYDERKEKSYQSRIWWCLGLISIVIFVSIFVKIRDEKKAVYTVDGVRQWYYLPGHAVPHQLFFGALTAFSGWKLWSIYRGKKHAEK